MEPVQFPVRIQGIISNTIRKNKKWPGHHLLPGHFFR